MVIFKSIAASIQLCLCAFMPKQHDECEMVAPKVHYIEDCL